MAEGGEYIEIAGGSITEVVDNQYNIYAGGNIVNTAAKSVIEKGENKGVTFGSPAQPPKDEQATCDECAKDFTPAQIKAVYNNDKAWDKNKNHDAHVNAILPLLNKYKADYNINTCISKAHFIAQVMVESGAFLAGAEGADRNPARVAEFNVPKKNIIRFHHDANLADYYTEPTADTQKCYGYFTQEELNSVIHVERVPPSSSKPKDVPKGNLPLQPLPSITDALKGNSVKIDQCDLYGHLEKDKILYQDKAIKIVLKAHKCFAVKMLSRAYASRLGNSDEISRDGYKFRGHGLIQLTGKGIHIDFGKYRKTHTFKDDNSGYIDFTIEDGRQDPPKGNFDKIADYADATYNVQSAIWYWAKQLDVAALNNDDIDGVTKSVNGGYNGLKERNIYIKNARKDTAFKVFSHYEKIYNDADKIVKDAKANQVDKDKAKAQQDVVVKNLKLLNKSNTKHGVEVKDDGAAAVMKELNITDDTKGTKTITPVTGVKK
jgi:predicted chitinase